MSDPRDRVVQAAREWNEARLAATTGAASRYGPTLAESARLAKAERALNDAVNAPLPADMTSGDGWRDIEEDVPEIEDFVRGVITEAEHQRRRWGEAHDRSKSSENWYWLVGYLGGTALRASIEGDRDKALHHTISAAAALSQWHAAIKTDESGRGIGQDADLSPAPPTPKPEGE